MKNVNIPLEEDTRKIPGFLLWQVSKLWQKQLEFAFKEFNLSHTQVIILGNVFRLAKKQKKVTQRILSDMTKIDKVTLSQAIKVLEKRKLIRRIISSEDKRANYLEPTEKGGEVTLHVIQELRSIQKKFFLPLEKEEIEPFIIALQKLLHV
jgi:MarR family transcriptional regulator, organic hydroperoxide resistance regulator